MSFQKIKGDRKGGVGKQRKMKTSDAEQLVKNRFLKDKISTQYTQVDLVSPCFIYFPFIVVIVFIVYLLLCLFTKTIIEKLLLYILRYVCW